MRASDYLGYDGVYRFPDLETALLCVDDLPEDSSFSIDDPAGMRILRRMERIFG